MLEFLKWLFLIEEIFCQVLTFKDWSCVSCEKQSTMGEVNKTLHCCTQWTTKQSPKNKKNDSFQRAWARLKPLTETCNYILANQTRKQLCMTAPMYSLHLAARECLVGVSSHLILWPEETWSQSIPWTNFKSTYSTFIYIHLQKQMNYSCNPNYVSALTDFNISCFVKLDSILRERIKNIFKYKS